MNYPKRISLAILAIPFLMLTGCQVPDYVRDLVGVYDGRSQDGELCSVDAAYSFAPVLSSPEVTIKMMEGTSNEIDSKSFYFQNAKTTLHWVRGSFEEPGTLRINGEIEVDFDSNSRSPIAVRFIDKGLSCSNLIHIVNKPRHSPFDSHSAPMNEGYNYTLENPEEQDQ